ncbi:MAG: hypothetical protein JMDDDDMK_02346 [Acidobacteria bacterium]|nr:hypothetical protein [Acidobacteriota bacterium]
MPKKIIQTVIVAAIVLAGGLSPRPRAVRAQQERCDSAADFVVQAREQARPGLDRIEAARLRQLLKSATSLCAGNGDAWYYRYLYSLQLGDKRDADYALGEARAFRASGLRRMDNPFTPVAAAAEVKLPPIVREKWALIIGIGKFQDQGIKPLRYTAEDAKDFAALLTDPRYGRFKRSNVSLLTDADATTTRIKSEIEHLSEVAKPEDLVVIYVSTHGSPRDLSSLDVNYLVTYDTNPRRLYTTSLPMVNVTMDAKKMIRAARMVIFLDTCFSGAATLPGAFSESAIARAPSNPNAGSGAADGSRAVDFFVSGVSQKMLSQPGEGAGRVTISASQHDQLSWESAALGNGIFTYYLIDALKQNGGMRTVGEVFNTLRDQVTQRVRAEKNRLQVPSIAPDPPPADIRIGVPPQSN